MYRKMRSSLIQLKKEIGGMSVKEKLNQKTLSMVREEQGLESSFYCEMAA